MKKSLKLLIVAIVVLSAMVFCLSACGGGNNGPVDYGFTLEGKTITFDGNTYSLTVGANTTALNGKTYNATYSYTKDGVEVSKDGVRDAGVYEVIANVLVQGEETPKQLKATLTINKMDVSVEIGDQIIRQGSTIASLPDPVIPSNVKLGVGDSISDAQFEVEYEIKKGSDVITSLSSASATTKEEDALTISYKFKTAPNNYNFTFKTGKGYVLSTTDYVNATVIKGLIDNLPSQSKLNTLTYENMKLFIADAKKLIAEYPNLSFVQQKIVGSCDMTSVNALLKTAESRLKAVYELSSDVDSSIGKVIFKAAQHINNDGRAQKDDDFISEFLGTKKSSRTNVEYKDVIAFEIWIKDTTKFALDSFFIGEKEYTMSVVSNTVTAAQDSEVRAYGDNAAKYVVGVPRDAALSGSYYGDENKGIASGGVAISSAVLGALDGDSSIEIKLNVNNKYTIEVADERGNEIKNTADMNKLFIQQVSVMARFVDYYLVNADTDSVDVEPITDGTTAKLTLVPLEGYVLKEVAIGDVIVPGSAFEKNVYEFVISEDYADDKNVISIVPTFVEKLTLSDVRINNSSKKLENLYRDGVYTDTAGAGSIVIAGGDLSYADPIFDGDAEMTITLRPATNYLVSALKITGYDASGVAKVINVDLEDIENNRYIFELEGKFDATKTAAMGGIKIEAEYKKSFNFSVSGARNEEGQVDFTFNGDSFVSKYGEVVIYKLEGTYPTEIKNFIEGDKILIAIDPEDGYVPKTIKINGKSVSRVDFVEEDKYQMIRGKMAYVVDTSPSDVVLGASFDTNHLKKAANYYEVNTATLAAGSNINIEVDFDAYYEIETDVYVSEHGTFTMSYKGTITDNGTEVSYAADGNPNNSGVINVKDKNFSYIYYSEKSPNRIYFTVAIQDPNMYKFTEVSGKIGKAELSDANITSDKSYKATIDEAIGGTPETVAPGSAITITFEVEPVKIG